MFLLMPVLVVALFTLVVVPQQQARMRQSLESQIQGTIASIVDINSAAYIQEDFPSIVDISSLVIKENPLIRYMVTSRQGGASILSTPDRWQEVDLSTSSHRWLNDKASRVIEQDPLTGERVYHHVFPVRFYNLDWGWIHVGVSLKVHDAQIRTMYLVTFAIGAVCVGLSALLAWYFARQLTTPLLHLKRVVERIRGGELGVRASVRTGDEVEQLADSFNATADALKSLTEELEVRVEERTLELKHSEERYRLLFENAAEAIFVLKEGKVRFWNPALRQLTGYRAEQLTGMPFAEVVFEDDRAAFLELMTRAETAGTPVTREGLRLARRSGEHVWVDVNGVAIRWDEDPALLCFVQDISERRALQVQLFHAQKMEAVGTLAGGIAHDFNNLLAGILGYVSLLQVGKDPSDPDYGRLQKIENQINSATGLTRQILGFARGGTYEKKPRDLNQVVQGAVELFGRTRRDIQVVQDLQEEGCTVDCDRGQIEQVLVNLLVNGAQAMPDRGTLTVRTRTREYPEETTEPFGLSPGWYVEVEVQDTGIGMDEATQARIFEPFFTTKGPGGGTGLGLASAYGIIKNHEGLIRVQSQVGHGSTFTCAFPRSKATVAPRERRRMNGIQHGEGTVLLVDDQNVIRTVGRAMLEMIGYKVLTAESGSEGLAIFKANPGQIDLVLLDMVMPGMGGGETFHHLRAIDPNIPVILASGYSLEGEVEALLACGCNGFLPKPFSTAQLSEKIAEVLPER